MKKVISLFLSIIMLLGITSAVDLSSYAQTYSGTCGTNVTWTFDIDTGELTISGSGNMTNYSCIFTESSDTPWFSQHSKVKSVAIKFGVTSIGDYAFSWCKNLTSITIPNSVTSIGNDAFEGCYSLTSVTIPDSVISIGEWAFSSCKSLINVTIPNSVTSIYKGAFGYCTSLTSVTIPESIISINYFTFGKCTNLTNVTIPNSVISIGESAFEECTNLTSVTIPDSVISIGEWAFSSCKSLTSVKIPDSIIIIDGAAFNNCTNLISVTVGISVTSIGGNAFQHSSLTDVYYNSTKSDWNKISIGDYNSELTSAQIHFRETEHIWDNGTVRKAATCEETGIQSYKCIECGNIKVEIIPEIGHDYFSVVTEATCKEQGYTTYTCSACGDSYTTNYTDIIYTHDYKTAITTPSTCAKQGVKTTTCSICGVSYIESIDRIPHTPEIDVAVAPTCEKTGLTEGSHCSVCGKIIKAQEVIKAGHKYELVDVVEPTCLEKGYTKNRCSVCGYEMNNNYTSKLEHKYELIETVNPTCLTEGYNFYRCNCGLEKTETLAVLEHTYELIKIVEATCLTEGYNKYKCSCGDEKTEIISYTEHDFLNGVCKNCGIVISDFVESKHPYTNNLDQSWIINKPNAKRIRITFSNNTVTESKHDFIYLYDKNETLLGCYSGTELASKSIIVNGDTVEIRLVTDDSTTKYGFTLSNVQVYYDCSHTESRFIKTIAPTCTENGYSLYNCSVCGEEYQTDSVNATGHKYGSDKITKQATCTANGVKTYTCATCKATKTETIKALGHKYTAKVVKPTYTSEGYTLHTCTMCKKNYKDKKTKKLVLKNTSISKVTAGKEAFTIKWKKVSAATGYQIQYATDKKFKKNKKTVTVSKNSTTSKKITKLSAKKKYYVRIRTYKTVNGKKYYSSWSGTKSIKCK